MKAALLILLVSPLLTACVARTAAKIVTLPVRAAGQVAETGWDAATTTQQEADEDRGREMRQAEERAEKDRRRAEKQARSRTD